MPQQLTNDSIARSLRTLVEFFRAHMDSLERQFAEFCAASPAAPRAVQPLEDGAAAVSGTVIDPDYFTVSHGGRTCFLGGGLPFRLLRCLARRPGAYFSHEDLLAEVWDGVRSASAIRSVVKELRKKLRLAGLGDLADAIDGSLPGHYALRPPSE